MNRASDFEWIKSRSNPTLVTLSKLKDAKYRRREGLYLAEGIKLAEEALPYASVAYALLTEEAMEAGGKACQIALEAREKGARLVVLSREAFEKVSTEMAPQGVVFVLREDSDRHETVATGTEREAATRWRRERLLFLSDVRDPGNLGTVLRSSAALGVTRILLSGCADIYNPKTVRASMGALFRMPLALVEDPTEMIRALQLEGRRVLAAALSGDALTLGAYETEPSDVPVIGNEGHGLSDAILSAVDNFVKIPMVPGTESLNAAVASAVILWEYFRGDGRT